ncbi:hypothetical protein [Micromonospora sp. NPDC000668]|uniref:hypothetical protein n=1 Tax=Micromonospora sp. NPDC000668 TaxID=3364219 RepID=UPI003682AD5E
MVQMVCGGTSAGPAAADAPGTWPGSEAEVAQVAVPQAPEAAAEWAEAITTVVAGAHHPDVKDVATYSVAADGKRRPGVRVSFTDGSDIFHVRAGSPVDDPGHRWSRAHAAEDHTTQLRLLAERRDDLAGERIRVLNRLHVLVRDLIPGGAPPNPPLKDARPTARSAPRMERRHIHPAGSLDNGSRSQPARYSRLRDPHGHPEPLDRRDRR